MNPYTTPPNVPRLRRTLATVAVAVTVLAACSADPEPELAGYELHPVPRVGHHLLDDAATGQPDTPVRADRGRLLLAFLGFTNCPDACPTALAEIRTALAELGPDAQAIDVAMITVDPQRDTPDALTAYVHQFVDDARALRTDDPDELQAVVTSFGATTATEHDHAGVTTDVGHTDYTYVIDDTGAVILTLTADMTAADLANDLRILLDRLPA